MPTRQNWVNTEDIIDGMLSGHDRGTGYSLVRLGDSEKRLFLVGPQSPPPVVQHLHCRITREDFTSFYPRFLQALRKSDVLGWPIPGLQACETDGWGSLLSSSGLLDHPYTDAWVAARLNTRYHFVHSVLGNAAKLMIVGGEYATRFPDLLKKALPTVKLHCTLATPNRMDLVYAEYAIDTIIKVAPDVLLVACGWWAPMMCQAAKEFCGSVAIDYGNATLIDERYPLNTEFQDTKDYYAKYGKIPPLGDIETD